MKHYALIGLGIFILGLIIYLTFIIAVIKISIGAILLLVTVLVLWYAWKKIKNKVKDKF
ncbi:hypothetical protein [Christiangramia salexigens]|uniref:hypothetical protein n=1 Tax=Christiangramia salexigens TaxID=1913577 RepID=UPI0018DCACC0|nr:hypothetical protein [Christiangramia salexigens]